MSRTLMINFLLASIIIVQLISGMNAIRTWGYVGSKSFTTFPIGKGMYSVYFSAGCTLTFGFIKEDNMNDLNSLPNSISSNFTIVAESSSYSTSYYSPLSFPDGDNYLVLINNGTTNCKYDSFDFYPAVYELDLSSHPFNLPYGVFATFKLVYNEANIFSRSNSSMKLKYHQKVTENPISTLSLETYYFTDLVVRPKSQLILPNINLNTPYGKRVYIYLYCDTVGGCPVHLSSSGTDPEDQSSAIAVGIVVPLLCIGVVTLIVIIILSSIIIRRRIVYSGSKAKQSNKYQSTFIPIQSTTSSEKMATVPQVEIGQPNQGEYRPIYQTQYYSITAGVASLPNPNEHV